MPLKDPNINVFMLYAEEDEALKQELEVHLSLLSQQAKIALWHEGKIGLGKDMDLALRKYMEESQLLLLLISANFLVPEVYGKFEEDIRAAYARQQKGKGQVIPVILRPCLWQLDFLSQLEPLPKGGYPVRSRHWDSKDLAFQNIAMGILNIVDQLEGKAAPAIPPPLPKQLRKRTNDKDQEAAQLINGLFEIMIQQAPEMGSQNVLSFVHSSLVVNGQLDANFRKYKFLKAYERLSYYRVPIQIKDRKASGRTTVGSAFNKEEGEEWIYTLYPAKDLGGLGGQIRIFFPKTGGAASITSISI
jgi:hypothetical protein